MDRTEWIAVDEIGRRMLPIAIGFVLALFVLAIPVYIRQYRPRAYRGLWKAWGDLSPPASFGRVGAVALAGSVGLLAYAFLDVTTQGAFAHDPYLRGLAAGISLMLTVSFIAIVLHRFRLRPPDR